MIWSHIAAAGVGAMAAYLLLFALHPHTTYATLALAAICVALPAAIAAERQARHEEGGGKET